MQKRKSGQAKEPGHGLTAAEHEERTEARKYRHAQYLRRQWVKKSWLMTDAVSINGRS